MEASKATLTDVLNLITFFLQAWRGAGFGPPGFTGATEETINEIASEFLRERLSDPDVNMYIVEDRGRFSDLPPHGGSTRTPLNVQA